MYEITSLTLHGRWLFFQRLQNAAALTEQWVRE